MDYTNNYKLSKPSYNDDVDVQVLNNNMDILDDNLQRTNANMNNYLPLIGGTMKGDIYLPKEIAMRNGPQTCFKFITENNLNTLRFEGEKISFNTPNNVNFKVSDTELTYNNRPIIWDVATALSDYRGYTKLSNGVILQWGYVNTAAWDGSIQHATFQTPYKRNDYIVLVSKSNFSKGKPDTDNGSWYGATYNFTTTGFDIICDSKDTGEVMFWLAIGRV